MISRRYFLRSAAVAPVLAVPAAIEGTAPSAAAVAELPPLSAHIPTSDLVLMQAKFEYAVLDLAVAETDEQCASIVQRQEQIEAQLTACVARTLSGLNAKARVLKRLFEPELGMRGDDDIQDLTMSLIDDIGRALRVEEFEAADEALDT